MSNNNHQSYGIKCEPDTLPLLNASELFQTSPYPVATSDSVAFQERQSPHTSPAGQLQSEQSQDLSVEDVPVQDMDLAGFLDMDDKALSELTGGVNASEWNSLFNGQLDGLDSLDPMTGIQNSGLHGDQMGIASGCSPGMGPGGSNNGMDSWLLQETHRLERQQKIQQQKLLELQQTLLKTEILKNQLQIATISQTQAPANSPPSTLLNSLSDSQGGNGGNMGGNGGGSFNFTPSVGRPRSSNIGNASPRLSMQLGDKPQSVSSPVSLSSAVNSGTGLISSYSVGKPAPLFIDTKPTLAPMPTASPCTTPTSPMSPLVEGDKRKVHNLIEKKYRCSINDRIGILRDKVSKSCKDSKRLQKSAVLQKTIDFIEHLERTIRRLEEENKQLRDALASNKHRMPSFSSPPATPHTLISPKSQDSEDSGHSSADDYLSDEMSRETSPHAPHVSSSNGSRQGNLSLLASHLLHGTNHAVPQYLMVVMLVAIFFVNPLALLGSSPGLQFTGHSAGSARTLSAYEQIGGEDGAIVMSSAVYWGLWAFRMVVAALCFGWATLRSVPSLNSNSQEAVSFWRLRKQAESDMQNGEFVSARENLEMSLAVIGRPVPTSYISITTGLIWSLISHFLFQVVIGQWAVSLASVFVCGGGSSGNKKTGFGVSSADISKTYHLLHQISMACANSNHPHGVDFYLGLNALNFAEADRPYGSLGPEQFAEMYFSQGLQSHFSMPYGGGLLMRYYFLSFRAVTPTKNSSPLKWTQTPQGKHFLQSGQWASEVKLGSRLFHGDAALPLYSVSRAFCKALLCETFSSLLLPNTPASQTTADQALEAFKWTLSVSKEVNSYLLSSQENDKHLTAVAQCSDSGFTAIQWWSSVGIVASHWSSGSNSKAEDYYSTIEGLPGDGSVVPSTLQLAFKASQMYKKRGETPMEVILQLCNITSNSLTTSVADLSHDHFSSIENELYRLGLLLACDWLLSVRVSLWEAHGKEERVTKGVRPGFYQDLETLSKLVTLLPDGLSRLRLYKGCYQLLAGANPMAAQALLGGAGYSRLRRRGNGKDTENFSVRKHLPSSVESLGPIPSQLKPTSTHQTTVQTPV